MTPPSVLTVILNYKTARMTLDAAAMAVTAMEGISGEIIIIDNASQDGSAETIAAGITAAGWDRGNRARLLVSDHNGGYGAGNNLGIRAGLSDGTAPDYIYILNSDAFPAPDAIRMLLTYLEATPRAGFAGSYIHGADGLPHNTAFRFPSALGELEAAARTGPISRLLARHIIAPPLPSTTCEVDWLAGASVMARQSMLDEIGLFDETFFLYFEETDLFLRARRAGWSSAYVRDSVVMHLGSISTGMSASRRTPEYWFNSRHHYFTKNHGRAYAHAATAAHLLGGLIWRTRAFVTRKPLNTPPRFLRDLIHHTISTARHPASAHSLDAKTL